MTDETDISALIADMSAHQLEALEPSGEVAPDDMILVDPSAWSVSELEFAKTALDSGDGSELGDLSDCPEWVRFCASRYIETLASVEEAATPKPPRIFQAKTDYERRTRRQIIVARADLWRRQDWLKGGRAEDLEEDFGKSSGVPDWVKTAALRELQQQIFNLSTAQRRNPAERNPL